MEAPLQDDKPLVIELPDEHIFQLDEKEIPIELEDHWDMTIYFNGSHCEQARGASIIFITP